MSTDDTTNRICALCGRDIPDGEIAAAADNRPLCHPDDRRLRDCYSMVTVEGYKLRPAPGARYVGAHRA